MTNYHRNWQSGGTYFFTVVVANRNAGPLIAHIDQLQASIQMVQSIHSFDIDAMVILPDHSHTIWTLPPGDIDYATRWKKIKAIFSKGMPRNETRSSSRIAKGERGIWQRRYWEHTIRDEGDFRKHCDYIHYNPVKHGYVKLAAEWPHSTFRLYVARGVYPVDWGGGEGNDGTFGE